MQLFTFKMLKRLQYNHLFWVFTIVMAAMINSCTRDIIEPDLNKATVVLIAPANGYETSALTHLFWWNPVKDAEKYNLQIVTTGFSSIQRLMLDTNLTSTKFSFTLPPGIFEWRVKAFNSSSGSGYSVFSLKIDSSMNLGGQTVVLVSPAKDFITNKTTHTFKWDTLYNADEYRFQIVNSVGQTVMDLPIKSDSIVRTLNEGTYTWQVRAQNASSNSPYSSRKITVDTTAAPVSIQVFPVNNDTIKGTDSLAWIRSVASIGDSLFIYTDSLLVSLSLKEYLTTTTYYRFHGIAKKSYYWRLKSLDLAGNWSPKGTVRKFWVK
jgi:hypothetical protein